MVRLVEVSPGIWRVAKPRLTPAKSNLSLPYVISDIMEPTEQVDGKFYTSKRQFRQVGRALGLTEVGNEKLPPKQRTVSTPEMNRQRREAIKAAIEKYRSRN